MAPTVRWSTASVACARRPVTLRRTARPGLLRPRGHAAATALLSSPRSRGNLCPHHPRPRHGRPPRQPRRTPPPTRSRSRSTSAATVAATHASAFLKNARARSDPGRQLTLLTIAIRRTALCASAVSRHHRRSRHRRRHRRHCRPSPLRPQPRHRSHRRLEHPRHLCHLHLRSCATSRQSSPPLARSSARRSRVGCETQGR